MLSQCNSPCLTLRMQHSFLTSIICGWPSSAAIGILARPSVLCVPGYLQFSWPCTFLMQKWCTAPTRPTSPTFPALLGGGLGVWARLSVVRVESGCEDAAQSKHALNVASAGASSQELVANSREAGGLFCFWPGSADATPQWQWKLETNICAGRGRRPKGKARSGPCLSCL